MGFEIAGRCRLEGGNAQRFAIASWRELAVDKINWRVLWLDPATSLLWVQTHPQSELHGGGPAVFVHVERDEAERLFPGAALE